MFRIRGDFSFRCLELDWEVKSSIAGCECRTYHSFSWDMARRVHLNLCRIFIHRYEVVNFYFCCGAAIRKHELTVIVLEWREYAKTLALTLLNQLAKRWWCFATRCNFNHGQVDLITSLVYLALSCRQQLVIDVVFRLCFSLWKKLWGCLEGVDLLQPDKSVVEGNKVFVFEQVCLSVTWRYWSGWVSYCRHGGCTWSDVIPFVTHVNAWESRIIVHLQESYFLIHIIIGKTEKVNSQIVEIGRGWVETPLVVSIVNKIATALWMELNCIVLVSESVVKHQDIDVGVWWFRNDDQVDIVSRCRATWSTCLLNVGNPLHIEELGGTVQGHNLLG